VGEVAERTGWLDLPDSMRGSLPSLLAFAEEIRQEGFRHILVLGMGGSSLAPDTLSRVFGPKPGFPELLVLDSTHPEAVGAVTSRLDVARTLFVVSSKSGTTTEPLAFQRFFWERVRATGAPPGRQFFAITDPATPLERLAGELGFRRVFRATSTVGGRYSALTEFGLVPGALAGVDLTGLLETARTMAVACGPAEIPPLDPALRLGAVLGELANLGRDKLTLWASRGLAAFPDWVEQLVAESTGKTGKGIVPVVNEPWLAPEEYGDDRLFVELQSTGGEDPELSAHITALADAGHPVLRMRVRNPLALGGEFFRWELAVASAATILRIDPFDQPDVELAKQLARQEMARPAAGAPEVPTEGVLARDFPTLRRAVEAWLSAAAPRDYLALQAYLAPTAPTAAVLHRIRRELLRSRRIATTLGFGPRFLHSTGQLHKGGPSSGLFLQIVDTPRADLEVPGSGYTFGQLIRAQSLGDYRALREKGRRVLRIDLEHDVPGGLQRLHEAIRG
jgi:transaldolase/glucose-6-phosphate isomerase